MKFLCPNCKAKYRIGPEKLAGRQVAKIRCRKCDYRIQIAPRADSEEYDVTASPTSLVPAAPAAAPKPIAAPAAAPKPAAAPAAAPKPVAPAAAPKPVAPAAAAKPVAPAAAPKPIPAPPVAIPKPAPKPIPAPPGARPVAAAAQRTRKEEDSAPGVRKPTAAVPGLPGLGIPRAGRNGGARSEPLGGGVFAARRPPAPPAGAAAVASAALTPAATAAAAPLPAAPAPLATPVVPPLAVAPEAPAPAFPTPLAPAPAQAIAPPPSPAPVRPGAGGTQLADQFRQSVQAGEAAAEEGPQDGWFVGVNGVPVGPIPIGDLRELAVAGHIDRKSLVWREGQAEWRPLGKFPHLARVLDEAAGNVPAPPSAMLAPEPVPAPPNGTNGHIATGFNPPRPLDTQAERPSAWGDLDEEDDEDEQPTTVKGRVSVPAPPAHAPMADAPVPAALSAAPTAPPPPAARWGGEPPTPGPASSTGAVSVPPPGASELGAVPGPVVAQPSIDPAEAARAMRGRGKGRVYAAVALLLIVVGALARHVLGSSTGSSPATPPEPAHTLASPTAEQAEKAAEPAAAPAPEAPADTAKEQSEGAGGSAGVQIPEAPPTVKAAGPVASPPPAVPGQAPQASKPANPSLLSGLGTLQTPGPAAGAKPPSAGAVGGAGLEATAIQRTVRRYSPAVRQNCWQRALNARAPGVPSSAKVTATITVEPSGRVQSVTASGAPRGYPGLARCIEDAVRGWSFPRAAGETVTSVPFMFVGQ